MGGETIFRFYGGHSFYEGGHRAHGGIPQSPPPEKTLTTSLDSHKKVLLLMEGLSLPFDDALLTII